MENKQHNTIAITRPKQGHIINKVIYGKVRTGGQLLDRYMSLVDKLDIVIPKNMMILWGKYNDIHYEQDKK
jgi:hypothetical protein